MTVNRLNSNLNASVAIKNKLIASKEIAEKVEIMVNIIVDCYKKGGKVLFCGNGGSAADAQHLAAELSGRYYIDRPPLFAEALHVNTSYLTAIANDYSFDVTYSRLTEAFGKKGDVLISFSTSGNSKNIVLAQEKAKEIGLITMGFTGKSDSELTKHTDYLIQIPSSDTPRIQESYMIIGHTICEMVEEIIFG